MQYVRMPVSGSLRRKDVRGPMCPFVNLRQREPQIIQTALRGGISSNPPQRKNIFGYDNMAHTKGDGGNRPYPFSCFGHTRPSSSSSAGRRGYLCRSSLIRARVSVRPPNPANDLIKPHSA